MTEPADETPVQPIEPTWVVGCSCTVAGADPETGEPIWDRPPDCPVHQEP